MKALIKRVGHQWRYINIANSMDKIEKLIGGMAEQYPVGTNATLIVDACAKEKRKKFNTSVQGIDCNGDILLVGRSGDKLTDLIQAEVMEKLMNGAYPT